MDVSLSHQCPQCGAPVDLEETDKIFVCPFCQVRLCIHSPGPFHYFIPPRHTYAGELVYAPYWRLRGRAFAISIEATQHKIVDATLRAVDWPALPPTLGLRPQALRLSFVEPDSAGFFLEPSLSSADFKTQILHSIGLTASPRLFSCLADSLCLIYQPVFQGSQLVDGISGEKFNAAAMHTDQLTRAHSQLQFSPALCPECGWDLAGDRQSLIQTCANCDTAWMLGAAKASPVAPGFFPSDCQASRYLPFWTLSFTATGFPLRSRADLIRLTNLAQAVLPWMESTPFHFRVPAFSIRPDLFLFLSRQLSLWTGRAEEMGRLPRAPLHAVNLPSAEAFQTLPVILGALAPARKKLFQHIQGGKLAPGQARIEYLPVVETAEEFLQPEMNLAIQKNALRWGAML